MSEEELKLLIYHCKNGSNVELKCFDSETMWATQEQIATLFDIDRTGIGRHIQNIFSCGELDEKSNVQKLHIANSDKPVFHYNLNVILSVGYRVDSKKAVQFRIWATKILREYLIKGFALDDEKLKDPNNKPYFKEVLERVKEIRTSEKLFYQQVKDIYITATDYEIRKGEQEVKNFFANIQNKLIYAITGKTAAELIVSRYNKNDKNFGLTNWEGSVVRKKDIYISKNYFNEKEFKLLKNIVNTLLDYMETQALREIPMTLDDWRQETDDVIRMLKFPLLQDNGKISHETMKTTINKEYEMFDDKRKQIEKRKSDNEAIKETIQSIKQLKHKIKFQKQSINNDKIKTETNNDININEIINDNPELETNENNDFEVVLDKTIK